MLKKRNKKGFTLVELLAVIVILAVVILIAVTAVIPRMNNAKKKALLDEALMYLKAAKESIVFDGDQSPSCINVSNLNEKYIKKSNDSYAGVVKNEYVNGELSQTINLTNGSLYIVGTDNLTSSDVKSTMPKGFAASCGDYNPILAENADTNTLAYKLLMSEGGSTLDANLSTINARTENVNFNQIENTAANSGLYKMEDDDGASFYFRGKVDNNWVEFAGFYWRVIRINGDGSVRILYSGVKSSNHASNNATIKYGQYGDVTNYNINTPDVTGLTTTEITTTYVNGRFANTYVGYMYNPAKIITTYPSYELNSTNNLGKFPAFTNISNTTQYYLFKNFDLNSDCFAGNDNDETGACTLKCKKLGEDCILTNWNDHATTEGNYLTSGTGTTSTFYLYNGGFPYTCWGYGTAVTKNNSNGTTSVYVSCPLISEIIGTIKDKPTQAKIKYHGLFSANEAASNTNAKDSRIKQELDSWYETNIYNKKDGTNESSRYLEEYITDAAFCNDRSTTKANQTFPYTLSDHYFYSPNSRLNATNKTPTFKCKNKTRDAFSLNSSTVSTVSPKGVGNGKLKYPIGLITADEVSAAGSGFNASMNNTDYYLNIGVSWWTISPSNVDINWGNANIMYVNPNGSLSNNNTSNNLGIRPVINLSSQVLYSSGSGTETDPYKVKLSA